MKKNFLLSAAALFASATLIAGNPATWTVTDLNPGGSDYTGALPNAMAGCAQVFGDYDNDGDLDMFYVGGQNADNVHVGLLQNNNGAFTAVELSSDFIALQQASAAWMDYNNDGNLDLIIVGTPDGTTTYTYVMKNLGAAEGYAFEEDIDNYLPGIFGEGNDNVQHTIAAIDYNNDGWTDLVLSGNAGAKWDGEHTRLTALFKNVNGIFEFEDHATLGAETFHQVNGGGIAVGDANNDGYMDLLISGYDDDADKLPDAEGVVKKGNCRTVLYINNGNGGFTKSPLTFAAANNQGLAFFVDANNDGWNDIVDLGRDLNKGWANSATLYTNANGTFTDAGDAGLAGGQTVLGMGDLNNDGNMDFVHAGWPTVNIAYGNGDNTFTEQAFAAKEGDNYVDAALGSLAARGGAVSVVDLNGDLTLDMHISGWSDANGRWSDGIAMNAATVANQAPAAPTNVVVEKAAGAYTISWTAATDDHTPTAAIRYNIAAQDAEGNVWMLVPADLATGKQKVAGMIPAYLTTTSYTFKGEGSYTFSVQAIDQANVGSAFVAAHGSAVENVEVVAPKKVVENGQIYILKGDAKYTVLGQNVK